MANILSPLQATESKKKISDETKIYIVEKLIEPSYKDDIEKYTSDKKKDEEKKAEKYIADENGYFKLTPSKTYRSFLFQLKNKQDELF